MGEKRLKRGHSLGERREYEAQRGLLGMVHPGICWVYTTRVYASLPRFVGVPPAPWVGHAPLLGLVCTPFVLTGLHF